MEKVSLKRLYSGSVFKGYETFIGCDYFHITHSFVGYDVFMNHNYLVSVGSLVAVKEYLGALNG